MITKSFLILPISHLSNDNAYSLFKSTADVALPVNTQLSEMLNAVLNEFNHNNTLYGEQVTDQNKSLLTPIVASIDKKNDLLLAEIKRAVVFKSKSRLESDKAAANELDFFFGPYWASSKKPIKTQADDLEVMFVKYHANTVLATAAEVVLVAEIIAELEASNSKLVTIYLERNEESGARAASGSDLRPAAASAYTQFCTAVEQAVNFTPTEVLITLFNNMESLRKKFSTLASDENEKPADKE